MDSAKKTDAISGELVLTPMGTVAKPIAQLRSHVFSDYSLVVSGRRIKGRFSEREFKFIRALLKTGNMTRAAAEIGISLGTAYKYRNLPRVREYLEVIRERAARAADLTVEKVAAVVGDAVDGIEVTDQQLAAAKIAAILLRPDPKRDGPAVINVQQNNFHGQSPFASLEPGAMLDEIKKNLLEMGHGEETLPSL